MKLTIKVPLVLCGAQMQTQMVDNHFDPLAYIKGVDICTPNIPSVSSGILHKLSVDVLK